MWSSFLIHILAIKISRFPHGAKDIFFLIDNPCFSKWHLQTISFVHL